MLPEETFSAGDWVIIHMGFVVEKTDKAGADAAMAGLEMMGRGFDTGDVASPIPDGFP
jgi:hydrogenase expression/formation protein HypC